MNRLRDEAQRAKRPGILVLEVMQKKLKELEAELEQRRRKEGDIVDLEEASKRRLRKKRPQEYDPADTPTPPSAPRKT